MMDHSELLAFLLGFTVTSVCIFLGMLVNRWLNR
jgi:hypothetical protein